MNLFIIKKATVIYRLISSLLFIVLSFKSFASEDLVSYCFEHTTNLKEAQQNLAFLLLPKEKVFPRPEQNCFDVLTSTDRSKLLEKFLSKRYTLISEPGMRTTTESIQAQQCQLELKMTKSKEVNTRDFRLGRTSNARAGTRSTQEVSTSQILLGSGRPGTLELEGRSLYIECRKTESGIYQLIFSYSEIYRMKVSSEVSVKRGESVQIAQVTNELASKSKTLGLPESLYRNVEGQENISYELKVN